MLRGWMSRRNRKKREEEDGGRGRGSGGKEEEEEEEKEKEQGEEEEACRVCGTCAIPSGRHALCCAPGPSREGHDEVRDLVLSVARQGDPSAESEAVSLLPAAPGRRPADVLTSAAGGNGLTALDIGVASPDSLAAVANGDALEAMRTRKLGEYRYLEADLRTAGLQYKPIPWSCWGREHPDTSVVLEALSR